MWMTCTFLFLLCVSFHFTAVVWLQEWAEAEWSQVLLRSFIHSVKTVKPFDVWWEKKFQSFGDSFVNKCSQCDVRTFPGKRKLVLTLHNMTSHKRTIYAGWNSARYDIRLAQAHILTSLSHPPDFTFCHSTTTSSSLSYSFTSKWVNDWVAKTGATPGYVHHPFFLLLLTKPRNKSSPNHLNRKNLGCV